MDLTHESQQQSGDVGRFYQKRFSQFHRRK